MAGKDESTVADGPFYIEQIECVRCGTCEALAPDLIGHETAPDSSERYFFKRQPESAGEIERAIRAINGCCVACIYYRGENNAVLGEIEPSFHQPACSSRPRSQPWFERMDASFRVQAAWRRGLAVLGATCAATAFCLAVFSSHFTASYARNLYILFLAGVVLFSAGRRFS